MRLRSGFTTGTAAAAATQAALESLLGRRAPEQVRVVLPDGGSLEIPVHACRKVDGRLAEASVIKDAGDDPDITHGAEIGARVSWHPAEGGRRVEIRGGPGVGTVTKPGLETPPGQAAITRGPRGMIVQAAKRCMAAHGAYGTAVTEIFVPRGLELARHTLNARLGILGGISILGSTGIVRPLSHAAYVATIDAGLSVARAAGLEAVVLTTGRRSERLAQARWPRQPIEAFVQMGDYFAETLSLTADKRFRQATLAVYFGKAVKMAQGIGCTHVRSSALVLSNLAQWTFESGDAEVARSVAACNTARQAFDLIRVRAPEVIRRVGSEMLRSAVEFGRHQVAVQGVIFGYDGEVRFHG